ncbi:DUF1152 domain-containing protein [Yinghuangia sp. ASG 101]|uniref:DUF1152 domain-containing protein n=1 Tax=Yinghuangia sp. ASG 101 TaxID=2896848 RepID=UPI001E54DED1|nr:DUF1152 domain-containing protein [Yinghuangia sp. ASG 101]UGQ11962.1 DUF1152 domain-containing protein [Yinghuangia sp. ASG 101]
MPFSLTEPPLFTRLNTCERILIAGAGGGFDVYAGLPLALALWQSGKHVHLANLSFVDVDRLARGDLLRPGLAAVGPGSGGPAAYFPERSLSRWLAETGLPDTVFAFQRTGVRPLRAAYQALVRKLDLDALVLVDGGTDILMRGDEAGLGTPEEDMTSLAAADRIKVPTRLVVALGFGVDAYHGVCHSHVLENLAALDRDGAYLGAFSIPRESREGRLYVDAVDHAVAETPSRPSIVQGSVAAAVRGGFGDVPLGERTAGTELFINPLMAMYFAVELEALARRNIYLTRLRQTNTMREVSAVIREFREGLESTRPRRTFPH